MTREEILAMPAGEKMDAAVAVGLGFVLMPADPWDAVKMRRCDPGRQSRWERITNREHKCYQPRPDPQETGYSYKPLPCYSLNVGMAWELVEWLKSHDVYLEVEARPLGYFCRWARSAKWGDQPNALGVSEPWYDDALVVPSAALAICRAFLIIKSFFLEGEK